MNDRELLCEYVEKRSESAFAELVARHINLVYSAALRLVQDAHLARDVAQLVFIELARKPRSVRNPDALAGWLYRAARFTAANTVRTERRLRERVEKAMEPGQTGPEQDVSWQSLASHMEEAMSSLDAADQDA